MDITTLLGTLVGVLSTVITIDKFLHTFGVSKLIAAQIRHIEDGAVAKAKTTADPRDDEVAAALQELAHRAADAYEAGDTTTALEHVKDMAAAKAKR